MAYRVVWDNGASASGTFPQKFRTFKEADAYGREWAYESNVRDFGTPDPDEGYTYEVVQEQSSRDPRRRAAKALSRDPRDKKFEIWVFRSPQAFGVLDVHAPTRKEAIARAWRMYPRAYSISAASRDPARRRRRDPQSSEHALEILSVNRRHPNGIHYLVRVPTTKVKRGYDLVDVIFHDNGATSTKSANRLASTGTIAARFAREHGPSYSPGRSRLGMHGI